MGGLVAEHAQGMELLQDSFADGFLEVVRLELLEEAVRRLAWKPQLPVKEAYKCFCEAA
jgi:hypothetical protein